MSTSYLAVSANLAGFIADLPTPFDKNGNVDLASLEKLCERQIRAGTTAIVVAEMAGESSTLSAAEQDTLVRAAVKAAQGNVSVVAGAGSNSTNQAVELTKRAEAAGADAILSVVPYYNKPTQSGIEAHFVAVANSTRLPIILHDIPARTMRALSDDTVVRLAQSKQFIGIRDGTGDVTRPLRLRSSIHHPFRLLTGDDAIALAYLVNGGDGCVSTVANLAPDLCRKLYFRVRQQELLSARIIAAQLAPLTASLPQETTSSSLKYALSLLGLVQTHVRLPMVELDSASKAVIAVAIADIFNEDQACLANRIGALPLQTSSPSNASVNARTTGIFRRP